MLIVGAGPTGLTPACGLARRGVPCRVIEAGPGPQRGSRPDGYIAVISDAGDVSAVTDHLATVS